MIIYDPEKDKAIQFTSDKQFGVQEAYQTARRIRKSDRANLEIFDNSDYDKFQLVDFRSLRYKSKRDPNEPAPGLDDSSMLFSEDGAEFGQSISPNDLAPEIDQVPKMTVDPKQV